MSLDEDLRQANDLFEKGELNAAIEKLQHLMSTEGNQPEICLLLGRCYIEKKWMPEAQQILLIGKASGAGHSEVKVMGSIDRLLQKILKGEKRG